MSPQHKGQIYLASPYSGTPAQQELRYEEAMRATAWLMEKLGLAIFSPILHCHPLSQTYSMPGHYDFWKDYNLTFIANSTALFRLQIDGWEASKGLRAEAEQAKAWKLQCWDMKPEEDGGYFLSSF